MKEIRPWYRWWWHRYSTALGVLKFRSSTAPSSCHGCYRMLMLLDAMWMAGGKLPTGREILWSLAGYGTLDEYEKVADLVEVCFAKSDDGLWFTSETLSEEWDSASEFLEKKREAGRKGGLAKGKHNSSTAKAELEHNPSTPLASSSSSSSNSSSKYSSPFSPSQHPDQNHNLEPGFLCDEWALKTCKAYPKWNDPDALTVSPARAELYIQTIERESPARGGNLAAAEWLLARVEQFAKEKAGVSHEYIPSIENFLQKGLYSDVKMPAKPMTDAGRRKADDEQFAVFVGGFALTRKGPIR